MTTKSLIVAEKPSVAADIAKALGGFRRGADGDWEREDLIVSNAIGHLVGIAAPEAIAKLTPVIPETFELVALPGTESQLRRVVKLMRRADVATLINSCDAGREGELIFRLIVGYAKCTKPIRRMWLQSMTPQAIRDGFNAQRSEREMASLAAAAFARAQADWIVGINGSRLCRRIAGEMTPVGRVQTPTLMIVVDREEVIRRFAARAYFEVHLKVGLQAGEFVARWQNPACGPNSGLNSGLNSEVNAGRGDPPERLWSEETARAVVARCGGRHPQRVSDATSPARSAAPSLFDLTTLQREANRLFGFSAKQTLDIAQELYEKYKVLTYPRTDAKALPEDYLPTVTGTIEALAASGYGADALRVLENGWIRPTKKIFDNSRISDHFAIIPTGTPTSGLSQAGQAIYDLVVRRLLAAFYPDADYAVTVRTAVIGEDVFVARGRVLVQPGWLAVYRGEQAKEEAEPDAGSAARLPLLQPDEAGRNAGVAVIACKTRPPGRFNEATLLSAMEHAGKEVEEEAWREAMAGRGLGTPSTRAATIEGLIADGYLARDKKQLLPTGRAFALKALLVRMKAQALLSPALTGEWEAQLKAIETNATSATAFRAPIEAFVLELAKRTGALESVALAGAPPCPACSKPLRRVNGAKGWFWSCSGYPSCRATLPDQNGRPGKPQEPAQVSRYACGKCGAGLINRTGVSKKTKKPYSFWSCSGYPACDASYEDARGRPAL